MTAARAFAVRLGRVRPKAGGELVPLRVGSDEATGIIKRDAQEAINLLAKWTDVKGFVAVWWDRHGAYERAVCIAKAGSPIPTTLMPSYVHDVLLREIIEARVLDKVRKL